MNERFDRSHPFGPKIFLAADDAGPLAPSNTVLPPVLSRETFALSPRHTRRNGSVRSFSKTVERPVERRGQRTRHPKADSVLSDQEEEPSAEVDWGIYGEVMATIQGISPGQLRRSVEDVPGEPGESALDIYLRQIHHELLTPEQEVTYAEQKDNGVTADRRLKEGGFAESERADLEELVRQGNTATENLINANLRLVVSVARKYTGRGMPLIDLIQEGNIGLMKGVEKYDYRTGYRVSTYVYWWIRQACTRSLADQGKVIRLPVHVIEMMTRAATLGRTFMADNNRTPSRDEVIALLVKDGRNKKTVLETFEALSAVANVDSLDRPLKPGEEDFLLGDGIHSDQDVAGEVAGSYDRALVEGVLDTLTPRERHIYRRRFGFGTDERGEPLAPASLQEVGKELGLVRERIRQIEAAVVSELRNNPTLRALHDANFEADRREGKIPLDFPVTEQRMGLSRETAARLIFIARQSPKVWGDLPEQARLELRLFGVSGADLRLTTRRLRDFETNPDLSPREVRDRLASYLVSAWNLLGNRTGASLDSERARAILRQVEITRQMAGKGLPNKAIAERAAASPITISLHRERLKQLGFLNEAD